MNVMHRVTTALIVVPVLCVALVAQTPATPSTSSARLLPAPAVPGTLVPSSTGQVMVRGPDGSLIPLPMSGAANAVVGGQAQDPQQALPPSQKLQRLPQLVFDRRPSSILAAWAAKEPEPIALPPELVGLPPGVPGGPALPPPAAVPAAGNPGAPPGASPPTTTPAGAVQTDPAVEVVDDFEFEVDMLSGVQRLLPNVALPPAGVDATRPAAAPTPGAAVPGAVPGQAANPAAVLIAKRAEYDAKVLARDLEMLRRDVVLGRWANVGAFLATMPEGERTKAYEILLRKIVEPPPQQQQNPQIPQQVKERQQFAFEDLLGVAAIAPNGVTIEQVPLLRPIVQLALGEGRVLDPLLALLRTEAAKEKPALSRRRIAQLLSALGHDKHLEEFLPTADQAIADDDREALNLIARWCLSRYAEHQRPDDLKQAFLVTLAALKDGKIEDRDKSEALLRAVELARKIEAGGGLPWLIDSFTTRPERGMEILATIGTQTAKGMETHGRDPEFRLRGLQLQKLAVEELLRVAPERAEEWRPTLAMLARHWMNEAAYSYTNSTADSLGPVMQRDVYGNWFWSGSGRQQNQFVQPLDPDQLLLAQPDGVWVEMLDPALKPRFSMLLAQLFLKVHEEAQAFPHLEALAKSHPESAKTLCDEFLRVWIRNHDPNSERNRSDRYMFMYGYDQRQSGIPLTRSKQDRNLAELAEWVEKLRALPIDGLDETLLLEAFTKSHSVAEVYRLDAIQRVFGDLAKLKPRTLAGMLQTMRGNLVSVWRRPDVQERNKTNRKQKDIEREVLAGYQTAGAVVADALSRHDNHWALLTAQAALAHDENNFRQEVAKSSEFSSRRIQALAALEAAAARYVETIGDGDPKEESTEAFDFWLYASLGACDIAAISQSTIAVENQPARIRAMVERMPEEVRKRHFDRIANQLFTRLSAVNPAVKFRYLKGGFEVIGDNERAREAAKVFDYYKDLITEVRLEATVDGGTVVGTKEPFGVRLDIRHTREIERESGGFGKYLQNQNNAAFSFNYGRPTENYREKFQEAATEALQEHFEVVSVTFNSDKASSKATAEYGWRVTPYAYVLLKARGPQVDRIPQLRLDLDFLDTSGYVVLPVSSPVVAIDASREPTAVPAAADVEITQILDERKAKEGKLGLEIKAVANGLLPRLEQLLDLAPKHFDVEKITDQGLSVSRFTDDQDGVVAERSWVVTMTAKKDLEELPATFEFAAPKVDGARTIHQRYADADLVSVGREISLLERYGERATPTSVYLFAGLILALCVGLGFMSTRRRDPTQVVSGWKLPEQLTPFTVLGLLREIEASRRLPDARLDELRQAIRSVERQFFAESSDVSDVDLRRVAEEWLKATA